MRPACSPRWRRIARAQVPERRAGPSLSNLPSVSNATVPDSRSEAEGTPKGLARPRSAAGPRGARGRLRRRKVRPTAVGSARGGGIDRAARPRALAARRSTAEQKEPRGRPLSNEGARRGRGGRPPLGGRAVGGRGGLRVLPAQERRGYDVSRRQGSPVLRTPRSSTADKMAVAIARMSFMPAVSCVTECLARRLEQPRCRPGRVAGRPPLRHPRGLPPPPSGGTPAGTAFALS
jgi:hypothetical protein